jgi:hypothetical protein
MDTIQISPTTMDCHETFSSRVDDTRRDGPSLYTALLENVDNSYGWGKATVCNIDYDLQRMELTIQDNGCDGFGCEEAVWRFFNIGKKNENVSEKTIGKYGKGGYKSMICMADELTIKTHFNSHEMKINTDFISMIRKNQWNPTGNLQVTPSDEIGTTFHVKLRPKYQTVLNHEDMKRNLSRAFHNIDMTVTLNGNDIMKDSPYGSNFKEQISYNIFWCKGDFISQKYEEVNSDDEDMDEGVDENMVYVGKLTLLVLNNITSSYDYLSPLPGLDIYRNNRLCNSDRPIHNLGNIGHNLTRGEGNSQGRKCHMMFEYGPVKLTDEKDMDRCVGLTSNKEISEKSEHWDEGLLKLLENMAIDLNKMYGKIVKDRIDSHLSSISADLESLNTYDVNYMNNTQLAQIKSMMDKYSIFVSKGLCQYDEDTDKWIYLDKQPSGEKLKKVRKGTNTLNQAQNVVNECNRIIKLVEAKKKTKKKLEFTSKNHNLEEKDAEEFIDYSDSIDGYVEYLDGYTSYDEKIEYITDIIQYCEEITKLPNIINISKYEELIQEYQEKLEKTHEEEKARILEEEEKEKARVIEEEEKEKARVLEEEEKEKARVLEEEEKEKARVLEKEEKAEKEESRFLEEVLVLEEEEEEDNNTTEIKSETNVINPSSDESGLSVERIKELTLFVDDLSDKEKHYIYIYLQQKYSSTFK